MAHGRGMALRLDDGAASPALTERQRRERAYYDEYARRTAPGALSFAPILGPERRPWNPYWFVLQLVREAYAGPHQRLLDLGCGPGIYSVMCARLGYEVFGFDISAVNVDTARRLAAKYELGDRTHFREGVAERLEYPEGFFDVVVGIDILHHVDIAAAIAESLRVLKPGGFAVFKEPIEAPLFDRLRNTRLGLWVAPKDVSFDRHITEDERKLTRDDLALVESAAATVAIHRFRVLARIDSVLGNRLQWRRASIAEIADRALLSCAPWMGRLAGTAVIVLRADNDRRPEGR